MKKALQFLLLLIASLYHIDSYAQIQKIEHKDRIGDSIEIIDIMPPQERIPLEPNFKGAWMLGGHIQTNGFGIGLQWDIIQEKASYGNAYRNKFLDAYTIYYHLQEIKHAKEISTAQIRNNVFVSNEAYILGKKNRLYNNQLGFAYKKALGANIEESSIAIHWLIGAHINLGLVKPYYLRLSGLGEVKYDEEIAYDFINPGLIEGKGNYFKGFNEIELHAGLGFKTSIFFNLARKHQRINAVMVYGGWDYFFKPIDFMVESKSKKSFYQMGISLYFGKYY